MLKKGFYLLVLCLMAPYAFADEQCVSFSDSIEDGVIKDELSKYNRLYQVVKRSEETDKDSNCSMSVTVETPKDLFNPFFQKFYQNGVPLHFIKMQEKTQSCKYCQDVVVGESRGMRIFVNGMKVPYCRYNGQIAEKPNNQSATDVKRGSDLERKPLDLPPPVPDLPKREPLTDSSGQILRYEHNGEPVYPDEVAPTPPAPEKEVPTEVEEMWEALPAKEPLLDRSNPFDLFSMPRTIWETPVSYDTHAWTIYCPPVK